MANPAVLFTVDVNGIPRLLFKVRERKGDLLISPKSPQNYHSSPLVEDEANPYKSDKFSVHLSTASATGINAIKRTMTFHDRPEFTVFNYTKGIKRDNKFVHIWTQRSVNLNNPRYEEKNSVGSVFTLGGYEPDLFVLYYSVWIGHRDREFEIANQTTWTYFRLRLPTLDWSFWFLILV